MLKSLKIENYVLIRKEELLFDKGFGVICGQTGAGKSVILQALGLLLGRRAEKEVLFDKEKKCVCEAVFLLQDSYRNFFDENDLDYESETVFRREILPSGKSRAFINDTPVSLSAMKELSERIIDIHSQHNTLMLNDKRFQIDTLDAFLQSTEIIERYALLFSEYKACVSRLQEVEQELESLKKENSYTTYVFEELNQAKLKADEQEELEKQLELMEASEEIGESISSCLTLFESEDYPSILTNLLQVKNMLEKASRSSEKMDELSQRVDSALIELRDVEAELQSFGEGLNFDSATMLAVKERLDLIYSLERKHNVQSVNELLTLQDEFSKQISGEEELEDEKLSLSKKKEESEKVLRVLADDIFKERLQAAKWLEEQTSGLLSSLGMQGAELKIKVTQVTDLDKDASCRIEYLFNANKGKDSSLRPIDKVASGGELSRLMLALKTLLSERRSLPTIVFDEIDSGISGETASKVARLMLRIGQNTQVLAITHLPQTAAMADYQFKVCKSEQDGETQSSVKLLDMQERKVEIARLLSSGEPSEAALANASELLQNRGL